jgi:hypothetical protein
MMVVHIPRNKLARLAKEFFLALILDENNHKHVVWHHTTPRKQGSQLMTIPNEPLL